MKNNLLYILFVCNLWYVIDVAAQSDSTDEKIKRFHFGIETTIFQLPKMQTDNDSHLKTTNTIGLFIKPFLNYYFSQHISIYSYLGLNRLVFSIEGDYGKIHNVQYNLSVLPLLIQYTVKMKDKQIHYFIRGGGLRTIPVSPYYFTNKHGRIIGIKRRTNLSDGLEIILSNKDANYYVEFDMGIIIPFRNNQLLFCLSYLSGDHNPYFNDIVNSTKNNNSFGITIGYLFK